MNNLGLGRHVDGIFYSARLGAQKPDKDFFVEVEAAVSLSGNELLLIDDRRQNTNAALDAGWQALHWTEDTCIETLLKDVHSLAQKSRIRLRAVSPAHNSRGRKAQGSQPTYPEGYDPD